MLSAIFTCCLSRRGSPVHDDPREREYLIPREPPHVTIDDDTTRRQREVQARLTRIVRAKEGKMVNLHSRLPFNLHNRSLSGSIGTGLDPSSSRSASDSLIASPNSPRYPITYASSQPHFYSSPLADSRHASGSRSSSAMSGQGGDEGRDGRGEDEEQGEGEMEVEHLVENRVPILNLRLVNPAPSIANNNRPMLARGRSSTKYVLGREEEEDRRGGKIGPTPGPQLIPPPHLKPDNSEDVVSPTSTVMPSAVTPRDVHVSSSDAQLSGSPPSLDKSFKIQETRPLVVDWGI